MSEASDSSVSSGNSWLPTKIFSTIMAFRERVNQGMGFRQTAGIPQKPLPAVRAPGTSIPSFATKKEEPKVEVKVKQENLTSIRPPTLSSLRTDTSQQHKRQRCINAQELVRTAGKENGLFTFRDRPDDVKDIYSDDVGNEALVVAYVEHIYSYLHQREQVRVSATYLDGMQINARMRSILMDWMVSVAYKFKMCQDSLFLAVDIVDRFLAIPELDATKDELQLVGVTAMFIAAKFEEVYPPELEDFVFIADTACSKKEILETEMMMTNALNFNFSRPSPAHFLRRIAKAAEADAEEYCTGKYITELSLLDVEFVAVLPSLIAAAAMYITLLMRRGKNGSYWDANMRYYSFHEEAAVKAVALKLLTVIKNAPRSRQQCIYKKYSSSKLQEVSVDASALAEDLLVHLEK